MKRMLCTLAVCLSLAAMLAGCGSKNTAETDTAAETAETEQSAAKELDAQKYAYDYDVEKLVELGDYKGLSYTKVDTSVSKSEINKDIKSTLESYAQPKQIKDRAVKDGDTVNIDFNGTIDGKSFDGGSSSDYSLEIGSKSFIDGFESGLIGHKPGEEVTLNLKFPSDYQQKDLAGKAVKFKVTINYIEGDKVVPELTDEFVKGLNISGVSTTKEYRKYVKDKLKASKENEAEQSRQGELIKAAVKNAKVKDYPEDFLKQYKDSYVDYYKQYADYYSEGNLKEFLAQYGQYYGTSATTEDELNEEGEKYAKNAAANMLVICAIADKEGVELTDEVYEKEINSYVKELGYESADALEKQYGKRYLKQVIIVQKVVDILEKDAKAVSETESSDSSSSSN